MLTENPAHFLNAAELADACTIGGVPAVGVFKAEYQDSFGIANGSSVLLLAPTTPVADGAVVVVRGSTYTVRRVQGRSDGWVDAILGRAT